MQPLYRSLQKNTRDHLWQGRSICGRNNLPCLVRPGTIYNKNCHIWSGDYLRHTRTQEWLHWKHHVVKGYNALTITRHEVWSAWPLTWSSPSFRFYRHAFPPPLCTSLLGTNYVAMEHGWRQNNDSIASVIYSRVLAIKIILNPLQILHTCMQVYS